MLSNYFKRKVLAKKFSDDLMWSLGEIKGKKVLLYGAGEGFKSFVDKYPFNEQNIVAIADMKFKKETTWHNFKAIPPEKIKEQDYDVILITNEYTQGIIKYLKEALCITDKEIRTVFNEWIHDERNSVEYLEQFHFAKHLEKLKRKLKGKKVVIYGAGIFFEAIKMFYDSDGLDIIAISDRKFDQEGEFLGYKSVPPEELANLNADYVLVATKFFINIIESLSYGPLKSTKTRIRPLLRKSFWVLWKEIWG